MARKTMFYSIVDPDAPGGVERVMRAVICRHRDLHGVPYELRSSDCPLHVRDDPKRRAHLPSLIRLAKTLIRTRPSVVNIHFVTAESIYFIWFKPFFRFRLVLSMHGSDLRLPDQKSSFLLPSILSGSDVVTVVSDEMLQRLRKVKGAKLNSVRLIPNGVDASFWTPPDEPRPPGSTVVGVGRLEKVKGFDILISAFAELKVQEPEARLVIIGEGSERSSLTRQAQDLNVSDSVKFAGYLEPTEIRNELRNAHLFALPSRSEGFPIALLEAMATGLPFVAANVGGVSEIATSESGICVPVEDPRSFGAAMARLLRNFPKGAAAEAARRQAEAFSLEKSIAAYLEEIIPAR